MALFTLRVVPVIEVTARTSGKVVRYIPLLPDLAVEISDSRNEHELADAVKELGVRLDAAASTGGFGWAGYPAEEAC